MADATPVNSKSKKAPKVEPIYAPADAEKKDEFKEKVDGIVAASVPAAILDTQINSIGSERNYGKVKEAREIEYTITNAVGDVIATRSHIRVDH